MSQNYKVKNMADAEIPESIYVVGFPKSGNTWLTRLLADVLQVPVRSGAMRGGREIAADINIVLSLEGNPPYEIQKIHFLPHVFFQEIDEKPKRIVYIYRDFRDVAISAFFYFGYQCEENELRIQNIFPLIFNSPLRLLKYLRTRIRFNNFMKSLCEEGIRGMEKDVGTWSHHIAEWEHIKNNQFDIDMVFISYEKLLKDTASALLNIIQELNLPMPSDERLHEAVDRQSFKRRKKDLLSLPADSDITFGKEFNVNFLRKGVAGGWRSFVCERTGKRIHNHHGKMLSRLMYESDPGWYLHILSTSIPKN